MQMTTITANTSLKIEPVPRSKEDSEDSCEKLRVSWRSPGFENGLEPSSPTFLVRRRDLMSEESYVDPYFFDENYTVAANTGFSIWEGSYLFLSQLFPRNPGQYRPLSQFIETVLPRPGIRDSNQKKAVVLELGSGTGITALAMACFGCKVVASDMKSIVQGSLIQNLRINSEAALSACSKQSIRGEENSNGVVDLAKENADSLITLTKSSAILPGDWITVENGTTCIEPGQICAVCLDWTMPLDQWPRETVERVSDTDVILGIECIWLKELLQSFIETIRSILNMMKHHRNPISEPYAYLIFTKRTTADNSTLFVTPEECINSFRKSEFDVIILYQSCEYSKDAFPTFFLRLSLKSSK